MCMHLVPQGSHIIIYIPPGPAGASPDSAWPVMHFGLLATLGPFEDPYNLLPFPPKGREGQAPPSERPERSEHVSGSL